MKKLILFCMLVLNVCFADNASIEFITYDGNKFEKIAMKDVIEKCKKRVVFRNSGKKNIPKYLYKSMIKASFTGKMVLSFEELKGKLKSSAGQCGWLVKGETI